MAYLSNRKLHDNEKEQTLTDIILSHTEKPDRKNAYHKIPLIKFKNKQN